MEAVTGLNQFLLAACTAIRSDGAAVEQLQNPELGRRVAAVIHFAVAAAAEGLHCDNDFVSAAGWLGAADGFLRIHTRFFPGAQPQWTVLYMPECCAAALAAVRLQLSMQPGVGQQHSSWDGVADDIERSVHRLAVETLWDLGHSTLLVACRQLPAAAVRQFLSGFLAASAAAAAAPASTAEAVGATGRLPLRGRRAAEGTREPQAARPLAA